MDYQLELKQIVDFPRCRIYREFIQTLIKDRNIRTNGSYHTTELGTHDHTIVSIMDCEAFPSWIKSRQKCIRTISEIS